MPLQFLTSKFKQFKDKTFSIVQIILPKMSCKNFITRYLWVNDSSYSGVWLMFNKRCEKVIQTDGASIWVRVSQTMQMEEDPWTSRKQLVFFRMYIRIQPLLHPGIVLPGQYLEIMFSPEGAFSCQATFLSLPYQKGVKHH